MFEFLFGRRNSTHKSAPKRRSLRLESLENRELLSVSPMMSAADYVDHSDNSANFATEATVATEAVTLPTVQGVQAEAIEGTPDVQISWNAVAGAAKYYVVRYSTMGGTYNPLQTVGPSTKFGPVEETSFVDQTTNPGSNYAYYVCAVSGSDTSPNSSYVYVTTNEVQPETPTGFEVVATSATAVQFTWDEMRVATWYDVERYDPKTGQWNLVGSTTAQRRELTITGEYSDGSTFVFTDFNLNPSTTYKYRLHTTLDWMHVSDYAEIEVTTTGWTETTSSVPSTPVLDKITSDNFSESTASLSWQPVAGAATYRAEYSLDGKSWTQTELYAQGTNGGYVAGLNAGTKYYFRVSAVNAVGQSAWSKTVSGTTYLPEPQFDDFDISYSFDAAGKLKLQWSEATYATSYIVYRMSDTDSNWKKIGTVKQGTSTELEYVDKSAKASSHYYYMIVASNKTGTGDGPTLDANTKNAAPGAPTLKLVAGQVNVSWKPVKGDGVTGYEVQRAVEGSNVWTTIYTEEDTELRSYVYVDSATSGNTAYSYRIIAKGDDGDPESGIQATHSEASKLKSIKTAPESPENVQLESVADKTATLTWDAVEGATSYKIEKFVNGKWSSAGSSKTNSLTVKSLKAQTSYVFRVTAVNKAGSSVSSETVNATTLVSTPKAPTLKTIDNQSISLKWSQVKEATGYTIQRAPSGTTAWEDVETVGNSSKPTYTDTGLDANTSYQYRIIALGSSEATNSSVSPPSKKATTAPAPPTNIVAVPDTKTVTLSWDAVAGATSYKVEKYVNGKWSSAGTSKTATLTVKSLKASTEYLFRATAVSSAGKSDSSEEISVRTLA